MLIPSKHLTTETNPQPQSVHSLVIVRKDTAVQTRTASAFSTRIYNMLMEGMRMAAGEHVCVHMPVESLAATLQEPPTVLSDRVSRWPRDAYLVF